MYFPRAVFAAAVGAALVLTIAGCSSAGPSPSSSPSSASSESKLSGKVAVLHSEPEGSPWSDLVYNGIASLQSRGVTVKRIAGFDTAAAEQQITSAAQQGYNPVVVFEDSLAPDGIKVAKKFPKTDFILFNTVATSTLPNVETVVISPVSAAYVAGVVAASTTKSDKLGFVGGANVPPIANYLCGFTAGVKSVSKKVLINAVYAGTFTDPTTGHNLAMNLFDSGDDIVMHAASLTGLGVLAAAKESGKQGIGVDLWQGDVAPGHVLWNALKDGGGASKALVTNALSGKFKSGQITWGADGQKIALYDDRDLKALPSDVAAKVKAAAAGLNDGSIKISC